MKKSKLLLLGVMAISLLAACQPDPTSSNQTTTSSKDETSEHSENTSSSQSETNSSSPNEGTITFPWV